MNPGDTVIYNRDIIMSGEQLRGTRGKVIEINEPKRLVRVAPESKNLHETWYLMDAWEVSDAIALCSKCGKNKALAFHTCPFKEEIRDDCSLCDCCEECKHECAMDI